MYIMYNDHINTRGEEKKDFNTKIKNGGGGIFILVIYYYLTINVFINVRSPLSVATLTNNIYLLPKHAYIVHIYCIPTQD